MLTASGSAPNTLQKSPSPTPDHWHGVSGGLAAAKEALSSGEPAQAELILLELLEFAPSETRGWKLLARTQRELGKFNDGINSAKRALQLQNAERSQVAPASLTLAKLNWQQGEHAEALGMLSLLLEKQPQDQALIGLLQQWDQEFVK